MRKEARQQAAEVGADGDRSVSWIRRWLEAGHDIELAAKGGSMKPTFAAGDRLRIRGLQNKAIQLGDVVLFARDGQLIAHRVVAMGAEGLVTRGDASPESDPPISPEMVLGIVVAHERLGARLRVGQVRRVLGAAMRMSQEWMRVAIDLPRVELPTTITTPQAWMEAMLLFRSEAIPCVVLAGMDAGAADRGRVMVRWRDLAKALGVFRFGRWRTAMTSLTSFEATANALQLAVVSNMGWPGCPVGGLETLLAAQEPRVLEVDAQCVSVPCVGPEDAAIVMAVDVVASQRRGRVEVERLARLRTRMMGARTEELRKRASELGLTQVLEEALSLAMR